MHKHIPRALSKPSVSGLKEKRRFRPFFLSFLKVILIILFYVFSYSRVIAYYSYKQFPVVSISRALFIRKQLVTLS